MTAVYEGVRIIDFTQIEQGPVGTLVLADFGAEVIKVERLDVGEIGRGQKPVYNGVATFFAVNNRNKKSLSLDVTKPEGKEIIYRLVAVSDVVASNFRPGVMERLGFGFQDLRKINPRIICAYASGYGRSGPYRDKRGQDLPAQAIGGLMALTGEADGRPHAAGTWVADYVGALLFAQGIMLALAARERTGEGQEVDTCLLNGAVAMHLQEGTSYLNTGLLYPRARPGINHAYSGPLYSTFQTRDGKWMVLMGGFVDRPWQRVCAALDLDRRIAEDPRLQTSDGLRENEEEVMAILTAALASFTREEAVRRLEEQDLIGAPVNEYPEVFADPQVRHNEMVVECEHPVAGPMKLVGIPVKLSATPGTVRMPAPLLGQHSEEILHLLGYDAAQIELLRAKGVVGDLQWQRV